MRVMIVILMIVMVIMNLNSDGNNMSDNALLLCYGLKKSGAALVKMKRGKHRA